MWCVVVEALVEGYPAEPGARAGATVTEARPTPPTMESTSATSSMVVVVGGTSCDASNAAKPATVMAAITNHMMNAMSLGCRRMPNARSTGPAGAEPRTQR